MKEIDKPEFNQDQEEEAIQVPTELRIDVLIEDTVWEAQTPLKGWAKTKAFIERVFSKG